MNISELSTAYINEKELRRRVSTVNGYKSSIRLYVLPEFGELTIEQITPEHIQEWIDGFSRPGAAKKAYKCLRQIIRWAIRKYRLRVYDPTVGIELPRIPAYRPETLDAKELRTQANWTKRLKKQFTNCIIQYIGDPS